MNELLSISILPVAVTLLAFRAAQALQQKFKSALLNPILVCVILVLGFCSLAKLPLSDYQTGMKLLSWLLTPATVCLAIPMYEQFRVLRKNLAAIVAGVSAGAIACLVMVLVFSAVFRFDRTLTVSLLPKSITTAIGVALSEMAGGIPAITTACIIITGIFGNVLGVSFCRLFRITDPVAQGVGFGTASHVIGSSKASELGPLPGAVCGLSLVVAGLLTAVILPMLIPLI